MALTLVASNSLRDGGSVYLTIDGTEEGKICIRFDYSLHWDGRERKITKSTNKLGLYTVQPNSKEERETCLMVKNLLIEQFGQEIVKKFEAGELKNPAPRDSPYDNFQWADAFHFLHLAIIENKLT